MQYSLLGKIINLFFPQHCAICERPLVGSEEAICVGCSLTLPYTHTWTHPEDNDMAKMFWHIIPIERCCSLFYYRSHSPSSQLLYRLKYGNEPELGRQMGRAIALEGMDVGFFEGIDAIIPIPLSASRLRSRGYNQSQMIAEGIASVTHLPVIADAVRRTIFTESQTHKNHWQRKENVEHVFQLSDSYPTAELAGKHLLMVDDVCTTGATLISCCQQLMQLENMRFSIATIGWARS